MRYAFSAQFPDAGTLTYCSDVLLTHSLTWPECGLCLEGLAVELAECDGDAVELTEGDAEAGRGPPPAEGGGEGGLKVTRGRGAESRVR